MDSSKPAATEDRTPPGLAIAATPAAPVKPAESAGMADPTVISLILMNISASVAIVQVNKWLVEKYAFKFILLLTSLHFFTGYGFLTLASREGRYKLFTRGVAPFWPIFKLALAGALSIALLNYSLRLNSVGTYQIMKVAVLPAVMALAFLGGTVPALPEVAAAALVVVGTLVCTVTDVWVTTLGVITGVAAVLSTAQYQIWQGSVQKELGLSSTQVLHLMSLPQGILTLICSLLVETAWGRHFGWGAGGAAAALAVPAAPAASAQLPDDIWLHPYSALELFLIFVTCAIAVALNYSTIGVIGKTSAVAMQFVNQIKTVLTIAFGLVLFPKAMAATSIIGLVGGLTLVFAGVALYTKVKQQQAAPSPASVSSSSKV